MIQIYLILSAIFVGLIYAFVMESKQSKISYVIVVIGLIVHFLGSRYGLKIGVLIPIGMMIWHTGFAYLVYVNLMMNNNPLKIKWLIILLAISGIGSVGGKIMLKPYASFLTLCCIIPIIWTAILMYKKEINNKKSLSPIIMFNLICAIQIIPVIWRLIFKIG